MIIEDPDLSTGRLGVVDICTGKVHVTVIGVFGIQRQDWRKHT